MSKSITQDMAYRQSLMKYAEKYGVYHGKTQSRDAPRNARFHGISFLFLPLQANIHRNSLLRKPYPFDILLTEKRSACFVASAPFVVLVIHFCLGFGSR